MVTEAAVFRWPSSLQDAIELHNSLPPWTLVARLRVGNIEIRKLALECATCEASIPQKRIRMASRPYPLGGGVELVMMATCLSCQTLSLRREHLRAHRGELIAKILSPEGVVKTSHIALNRPLWLQTVQFHAEVVRERLSRLFSSIQSKERDQCGK